MPRAATAETVLRRGKGEKVSRMSPELSDAIERDPKLRGLIEQYAMDERLRAISSLCEALEGIGAPVRVSDPRMFILKVLMRLCRTSDGDNA